MAPVQHATRHFFCDQTNQCKDWCAGCDRLFIPMLNRCPLCRALRVPRTDASIYNFNERVATGDDIWQTEHIYNDVDPFLTQEFVRVNAQMRARNDLWRLRASMRAVVYGDRPTTGREWLNIQNIFLEYENLIDANPGLL